MFELSDSHQQGAKIKVVGIGGGGGNAVQHMIEAGIDNVDFIAANTDSQVLNASKAPTIIQLGELITKGLGAGADPEMGRQAAEEDRERIAKLYEGTDMLFLTAGMGGGTGTGAAPVFAQIARDMGILTVAVVTRPFSFEGTKRQKIAEEGIKALSNTVDSLIIVPNDKLLAVLGTSVSLLEAFKKANDVLQGAVQGISDLITRPGLINVDYADVKTVMSEKGTAMMGSGMASGENRAKEAATAAISSPLLEDIDMTGARGILVNLTGGLGMTIGEFEIVGAAVKALTSDDATVVVGTVIDPEMEGELRVTVVVTGLGQSPDVTVPSVLTQQEAAPIAKSAAASDAADYTDLDKPAVLRQRTMSSIQAVAEEKSEDNKVVKEEEIDILDIPAFLRREEDVEA